MVFYGTTCSQDSLEDGKAYGGRMPEINLDLFSAQSEMCTSYCKNNKLLTNSYVVFHTSVSCIFL